MKFEDGFSRRKRAGRTVTVIAALLGSSVALAPTALAAQDSTKVASPGLSNAFINAEAKEPSMSADGRYVAYMSAASNIVDGDSNGLADIFVYDRVSGETVLASRATNGTLSNGVSEQPSISPDGRYLAFVSMATNFAPETNPTDPTTGQPKNVRDIFLRDLKAGTTERITRGGGNLGTLGGSFDPSTSRDGAFVAFTSLDAAIAGAGDCNNVHDVFVWERATKIVKLVPVGTETSTCGGLNPFPGVLQGNRESQNPSISADGRFIAYSSDAYNLDPAHPDSHKYDLPAPPLVGNPTLGTNIFLWDRTTGKSTRIDNAANGAEPNGDAGFVPAISGDGGVIAYMSRASDLVSGDTNGGAAPGMRDTFVYNVQTQATTRVSVSAAGAEQKCQGTQVTSQAGCQSYEAPALSHDGRYVAFVSGSNNLVLPDSNVKGRDVYVRDTTANTLVRVNVADNGAQADGNTIDSAPVMSADGRYVAFTSLGTNVVPGDTNGVADIFVNDSSPAAPKPATWTGAPFWKTDGGCIINCGPNPGPGPQQGTGYWMVASDGGIFAFGDAAFKGSTGNIKLAKPIVGMTTTPSGNGYWLVASDGGIFAFGDAAFKGSTGDIKLAKPIEAMTATKSGNGYWMVASDGGIFAFGDAAFKGSTGNIKLAKPIVGMSATPGGNGYWLVASDGGIFAFGDAAFKGSTGNIKLNKPIVGMTGF
jgi:Tol biopolymer transport system component